jgi:hypothetical protein
MTKTSCIPRIADDTFLVIRTSYVRICRGDVTAAALIHIFEQWHNVKLAARQNFIDMDERPDIETPPPPLWQFHKNDDLEAMLMGIGKRDRIDRARKLLQEMGVIDIGRNPNKKYKFDATTFYLFHPEVVTDLLKQLPPIAGNPAAPVSENDTDEPVLKTGNIGAENSRAIPKDSPSKDSEGNIPAQAPGEINGKPKTAAAGGKKATPAAPPRPYWQRLVDTWYDFYKSKFPGEEPNFLRRQPAVFGQLVDLLQARAKKKKAEWTETYAVDALKYFLKIAFAEDWLSKHFLLTNLVDQFDAVYARAATNGTGKQPAGGAPVQNVAARGPEAELNYIQERYREPDFDERIVLPEHYDYCTSRGKLPIGTMNKFEARTIEEQKRLAVLHWLKENYKPLTV